MLAGLVLGIVAIGLIVGRLYSFVGVLAVSPLVFLLSIARFWPRSSPAVALAASAGILAVLHGSFLLGVLLRLRSERARPDRVGAIPNVQRSVDEAHTSSVDGAPVSLVRKHR